MINCSHCYNCKSVIVLLGAINEFEFVLLLYAAVYTVFAKGSLGLQFRHVSTDFKCCWYAFGFLWFAAWKILKSHLKRTKNSCIKFVPSFHVVYWSTDKLLTPLHLLQKFAINFIAFYCTDWGTYWCCILFCFMLIRQGRSIWGCWCCSYHSSWISGLCSEARHLQDNFGCKT